jgi:ZIP family zinc transporter
MTIPRDVGMALLLTLLAGLSTGIGSTIAYFIRRPRLVYLAFSMGLSAGAMVYVSLVEMLPKASNLIGHGWGVLVFFIGILFIGIIDLLVPEVENPHHFGEMNEATASYRDEHKLMRAGVLTAVAIGIHNLPEGLATFTSALSDFRLGILIAVAIAIHNIPEGIAVSVPIFYATSSRNKALFYSFLSGVSEPLGAVLGILVLFPFLTPGLLAGTLAFAAGIMVYISLDELLPTAHRYGEGHFVIGGVVFGMLLMAVSLLLLGTHGA